MTTNFFVPPSGIHERRVVLPEGEARHLRSVLRGQEGDEIVVVDGAGGWYRVEITHLSSEQVVGRILEARADVREPDVHVTVGFGILKKRSRVETFVEKAVELGVRRIVPLKTAHTERTSVRGDRLKNVMIAAVKQCRRSWLPGIGEAQTVQRLLQERGEAQGFVCRGDADDESFSDVIAREFPPERVLLLVGPEGGFADAEVTAATDAGLTPVSLGARRLRAETAALTALSAVTLHWG